MKKEVTIIRWWLGFFILSLILSGLTAIPVDQELSYLLHWFSMDSSVYRWLIRVLDGYREVDRTYPFLLYGYDWLAFAHFVLAILFIGPFRDPVKNIWVIEFGLIACVLVIPLALIAGHFRGIPVGWRLLDCSFGLLGFIPLSISYQRARRLSLLPTSI
jgi:hypothetical protein